MRVYTYTYILPKTLQIYTFVCMGSRAHTPEAGVINVTVCFPYKLSCPTNLPTASRNSCKALTL